MAGRSAPKSWAPDESRKGAASLVGDKLIGIEKFRSGARQYQVAFDAGFTSCTLTVLDAMESGQAIRRKAPNGEMVEIRSSASNSPSCSIENGNALGSQ